MGLDLRLPVSRTALAVLLAGVAVAAPLTAWYVAGSRATEEHAGRVESTPLRRADAEAFRGAELLARRLEALRLSESRRAYRDYWRDDEPIAGDCEYEAAIDSPLLEGPADPLIWAHFQIDDVGRVTLPTLSSSGTATGGTRDEKDRAAIQLAILEELECASSSHLAALGRMAAERGRRNGGGGSTVTVGPFSWHTVSIRDEPALVAVREVEMPAAVLTQGFVVLSASLQEMLADSTLPARARPGPAGEAGEASLSITGDPWSVMVDASADIRAAALEAAAIRGRFRRLFGLGALAVMAAGASMVLLVRQSERLAHQRSRFAAAAAHELRTPLAGLQLYGEMLAEEIGDPDRRRQYASRVADEAARLGRVVSNVLGFAGLQRDSLGVRPEKGDLASAVRNSVERLRPGLENLGATIDLQVAEPLPEAAFDPDALHQILQNLLDNAEKYSRDSPDRTVRVLLESGAGGPVLSVVDHGPGLSRSARRDLFRPFTRPADPDSPSGLGIGLAMAAALARAQRAELSHTDAAGGGARFSVRFPTAA
jgi:signal transduction histidine kinase